MCEEAVEDEPETTEHVPDLQDFDDSAYLIRWRNAYQKCKAQKAQIKKELKPIAWHPSRWWDWCMPEDEKQETEKLWA